MPVRCRVRWCRFSSTHTTHAHRCGRCGALGHGQMECGDADAIARLARASGGDALTHHTRCRIAGCPCPATHTTEAHHCSCCGRRGVECIPDVVPEHRSCPTCRVVGRVDVERTVYTAGECVVCYEAKPMVVFEACAHANVCRDCAERLPLHVDG